MNLDFSALDELENKAIEGDCGGFKEDCYIVDYSNTNTPKKGFKQENKTISPKNKEEDKKKYLALEKDKELLKITKDNAKRDKGNIKKSEKLRVEINKEIKADSGLFIILIKALKCITLMTGDSVFYDENLKELITNQTARGNPDIKLFEIEEIEEIILSLKAEEQTPEIKASIAKHEKEQREILNIYNHQLSNCEGKNEPIKQTETRKELAKVSHD